MKTLILVTALFNIGFGLFHLCFWRLFDWKVELGKLQPVNQGIVPVLNLALTFLFLLVGVILLIEPPIRSLIGGMALFWLFRAALQPPYFGLRHPLSKLMMVLFVAGSLLHATAWWLLR